MEWKIPIQWMTPSCKLGCLGESVVLRFVFFLLVQIRPFAPASFMWSWTLDARACLLHWYHIQWYTKAAPNNSRWQLQHICTLLRAFGRTAWCMALSLVNSCVETKLLPRAMWQTPSKPTHLHMNNTFLIISSFMLNVDIHMLHCLSKIVLIHEYGT